VILYLESKPRQVSDVEISKENILTTVWRSVYCYFIEQSGKFTGTFTTRAGNKAWSVPPFQPFQAPDQVIEI